MGILKSAGVAKSIDDLRRTASAGGGRSGRSAQIFIKPDSSLKFRFLTEPTAWMEYQEHYDEAQKKFVPAIDNDPLDNHPVERTRQTSRRWLANILNVEDGRVHILKLNNDQVNKLLTRFQRYGTIMDRNYEIIREGGGRDSKYDMDNDDPQQMDLSRHMDKLHDLEDFLLGEVDNYHQTSYQADAREAKQKNGGGGSADDVEASVAAVETAAQKVATADETPPWTDKDLDDPKLNAGATVAEMTPTPVPAPAPEPPSMAEIAAETEAKKLTAVPDPPAVDDDPWVQAKANGQPCVKGDEGTCAICGFDVSQCLMKT